MLYDFEYSVRLIKSTQSNYKNAIVHFGAIRTFDFILWMNLSPVVGLLIAFLISLGISIKQRWFWVNSIIVFVLGALLLKFDLYTWQYLSYVFNFPGKLFKNDVIWRYLTNGMIMLTIGLLLFLLKASITFINSNHRNLDIPSH